MRTRGCAMVLFLFVACILIWIAFAAGLAYFATRAFDALVPGADAVEISEPLPKGSAQCIEISKRQRAESCIFSEKMQEPAAEPAEDPEDHENEKIEAALLARSHKIENCKITYYCCEKRAHICGTGDGLTALGGEVTPWVSCAVPRGVPLGSTVMIDWGDGSIEYRRADDRGDAVRGDHIDLAVPTHAEALEYGVKRATVYWCEEEL